MVALIFLFYSSNVLNIWYMNIHVITGPLVNPAKQADPHLVQYGKKKFNFNKECPHILVTAANHVPSTLIGHPFRSSHRSEQHWQHYGKPIRHFS